MRELQQQLLAVMAAVVSLGQAKFSNGWDPFKCTGIASSGKNAICSK